MIQANRMVLPRSRISRVPAGVTGGEFLPPDDSFTAGKKGNLDVAFRLQYLNF